MLVCLLCIALCIATLYKAGPAAQLTFVSLACHVLGSWLILHSGPQQSSDKDHFLQEFIPDEETVVPEIVQLSDNFLQIGLLVLLLHGALYDAIKLNVFRFAPDLQRSQNASLAVVQAFKLAAYSTKGRQCKSCVQVLSGRVTH